MTFEEACRKADLGPPDLLRYWQWCDFQERRYDCLPPWYWNQQEVERRYVKYVEDHT